MGVLDGQAEFVFHYVATGDLEEYINVLGVDPAGLEDGQTLDDDAAAMEIIWSEDVMPFLSEEISLTLVEAVIGETLGSRVGTAPSTTQGGRTGQMECQNVCYLVRKRTGGIGRGKNGRMYLPGVPASKLLVGGQVDPGEVSNITGAFTDMLNAADYDYVVNHGAGSPLAPASLITSFACDTAAATQRRRLRR